jgi:hypothetical protein
MTCKLFAGCVENKSRFDNKIFEYLILSTVVSKFDRCWRSQVENGIAFSSTNFIHDIFVEINPNIYEVETQ